MSLTQIITSMPDMKPSKSITASADIPGTVAPEVPAQLTASPFHHRGGALLGGGGLDGLAVDDPRRWAGFPPDTLPIDHQRYVVDRLEQEAPDELSEPPIHCLPRRKILGQHPPPAAGSNCDPEPGLR